MSNKEKYTDWRETEIDNWVKEWKRNNTNTNKEHCINWKAAETEDWDERPAPASPASANGWVRRPRAAPATSTRRWWRWTAPPSTCKRQGSGVRGLLKSHCLCLPEISTISLPPLLLPFTRHLSTSIYLRCDEGVILHCIIFPVDGSMRNVPSSSLQSAFIICFCGALRVTDSAPCNVLWG